MDYLRQPFLACRDARSIRRDEYFHQSKEIVRKVRLQQVS
jgi:hypothetical protein